MGITDGSKVYARPPSRRLPRDLVDQASHTLVQFYDFKLGEKDMNHDENKLRSASHLSQLWLLCNGELSLVKLGGALSKRLDCKKKGKPPSDLEPPSDRYKGETELGGLLSKKRQDCKSKGRPSDLGSKLHDGDPILCTMLWVLCVRCYMSMLRKRATVHHLCSFGFSVPQLVRAFPSFGVAPTELSKISHRVGA